MSAGSDRPASGHFLDINRYMLAIAGIHAPANNHFNGDSVANRCGRQQVSG